MSTLFRFIKNPLGYINKLKYYIAGMYFDSVIKKYRFHGCEFEVPRAFTTMSDRGYFTLKEYEKIECQLVCEAISPENKVIELGGCIGVVSCIANKILNNPSLHVVVEANAQLIPYLKRNRDRNNARFQIENAVISNDENILFYENKSMVMGSLERHDGRGVNCKNTSFLDIEEKFSIRFDTLIMDIEGAEYDLIIQNKNYIQGLRLIIMENHPDILGKKIAIYEEYLSHSGFIRWKLVENVTVWKKG